MLIEFILIKHRHILLIICLLHSLCKGQTYFNNYYGIDYISLASTNIFMEPADSSFTFFSYTKNVAGGRQDFTATYIDKNGLLIVNKNHNINNYDYSAFLNGYRQFIPATKSSYFGSSLTTGVGTTTVILNKISKSTLDTLYTKYYNDPLNYYSLNNFIKFNDNKYLLIGNKNNGTTSFPIIFHLDSNLNIINTITINTALNFFCNNAAYNPVNKRILFGGYKNNTSNQVDLDFVETDTLGNITNTLVIGNQFLGISQLKYSSFDNSYVFNGAKRTSKYGSNSMFRHQITKLNSLNLNIIWSKTYSSASILNSPGSMIINNDGSIVECGRYADSTSLPLMNYDCNGFILKVNAVGDSLWMRQYNNYQTPPNPLNYWEAFYGIEKIYDGGYIACGGVMNEPQGKAWILKTDSLGCLSPGCGSVINGTPTIISGIKVQQNKEETQNIVIYPNPANNILNVEMLNLASTGSATKLEIINSLGQVLSIIELSNQTSTININELPSGLYQLKLNEGSEQRVFKFIKN